MKLTREVWKDIPSFPGYQASSFGRVRSLPREETYIQGGQEVTRARSGRIMSSYVNGPYVQVALSRGGKQYCRRIHRLVAEAFLGPSNLHVDHINNDGLDNRLSNLRYLDAADNIRKALGYCTNCGARL